MLKLIIIYFILGLIQGFSEPIPISSSGHLVIFQSIFANSNLLSKELNDITFEVLVNTGSLIAILHYYRNDLKILITNCLNFLFNKKSHNNPEVVSNFRYAILIIIATIPAAIIGVLFEDYIASFFGNVLAVGICLLITGSVLLLIHNHRPGNRDVDKMSVMDAITMGIFQCIALLPGISRSGATISGGLLRNLDIKTAMKTSFMMYIPVSLGAVILKLKDLSIASELIIPYFVAFITSIFATYFALKIFFSVLKERKLNYFAYYCFIVGGLTIIFLGL